LFSRFILAYYVLAGNLKQGNTQNQMKLLSNVCMLITSYPLGDIYKSLHATSTLLEDIEGFNNMDFKRLTLKSDGLFK